MIAWLWRLRRQIAYTLHMDAPTRRGCDSSEIGNSPGETP